MGLGSTIRLPLRFCLNQILVRLCVRPRPAAGKASEAISAAACVIKSSSCDQQGRLGDGSEKQQVFLGRKIMVVVDSNSSRESKAALQWALSHALQTQDTLVLFHVMIKSKPANNQKDPRTTCALLHSMNKFCLARRPEIKVEVCVVEGKEQGPAIVEEAKKQGVALLVLGAHRKRSTLISWWRRRLLMILSWHRRHQNKNRNTDQGVVEHCIKNAECVSLAVRRRSPRAGGGYLITTKTHKDFWLLA